MTPTEFKSWFEGFTEALTATPTKTQWARIKERVAEIDGKPVTERHYIDRYWPQYLPYLTYISRTYPTYTTTGVQGQSNLSGCSNQVSSAGNQYSLSQLGQNFSSTTAMYALGKADAESIK